VGPGSATITATWEGVQGSAVIAVLGPVASVTIVPGSTTILQGESTSWQAEVRDTGANLLERTAVAWSSSDPAVATVDLHGSVIGTRTGTAEIAATAAGIAGAAVLTVRPAPDLRGTWSMAAIQCDPATRIEGSMWCSVPIDYLAPNCSSERLRWSAKARPETSDLPATSKARMVSVPSAPASLVRGPPQGTS
jgi:Big-like domain-containing protein